MRPVWIVSVAIVAALTSLAIVISGGVPGAVLDDDPDLRLREPADAATIVTVTVEEGASAREIAEALAQADVIESARLFRTLVSLLGYDGALQAGVYDLERTLTTVEVIERIRTGLTSPRTVTIPEGLQVAEVADRLADAGVVPRVAFLAALQNPANWAGTVAAQRPAGASLEGYLFPSTYRFSLRAGADDVVSAMIGRLESLFTPERRSAIAAAGLTIHEILTLASIVERETAVAAERSLIASVFLNRLAAGIPLAADPTVQYALSLLPGNVIQFGYWKAALTGADLATDSPFNTYLHPGYPPTPIANAGLGAIEAAIQPAESAFFFFVARGDGSHAFATTFDEHQRNVAVFQGTDGAP